MSAPLKRIKAQSKNDINVNYECMICVTDLISELGTPLHMQRSSEFSHVVFIDQRRLPNAEYMRNMHTCLRESFLLQTRFDILLEISLSDYTGPQINVSDTFSR